MNFVLKNTTDIHLFEQKYVIKKSSQLKLHHNMAIHIQQSP